MGKSAVETTEQQAVRDETVDEAIRLAGGDPREAIRGLIFGQQDIESRMADQISAGYVRRRR